MISHCVRRVLVVCSFAVSVAWTLPAAAVVWSPAAVLNTDAATDDDHRDYYLNLADDGAGNWVCVWCMGIGSGQDRDFDILVARSNDYGATWTAPAILDPFADAPPAQEDEDDFHPFVVTDGGGNWVASWYTHDDHGGTIGANDTDLLVSASTNGGASWTSSVPLNSDAGIDSNGDSSVSMATDGNGLWVAVWTKYRSSPLDADIHTSHSTDNGLTWSTLSLLHPSMATDPGDDGSPSVATDGAGHWLVVWNSENVIDSNGLINTSGISDNDDVFVSTSTNGISWTAPATLNSDAITSNGMHDRRPRIAYDGIGRWVTVWYHGVYEIDYDIEFSYSDDSGATWSPAEYLNDNALTDSGRDLYPVPATDGNGNWMVVWQSKDPVIPPVGSDYDILYSYSTDNAEHWSSPWFLNSFAPADFLYDRDPEVAYAGNGKWRTAWGSNYNLGGAIGGDYDLMISSTCLPQIPGDHDCDGDFDLADFAGFPGCLSGPIEGAGFVAPTAVCLEVFDFPVPDGDVDLLDFAAIQEALD